MAVFLIAMRHYRQLALLTLVLTAQYALWLCFNVRGVLGFFFLVVELSLCILPLLFLINHWNLRIVSKSSTRPSGEVDIFITVVDEPLDVVAPVVRSAAHISYADKRVYVLDDKGRDDIRMLAESYDATYLSRADTGKNAKAGNLNFGLAHSTAPYILVLDADQVVTDPAILDNLLGYFIDEPRLAFVTTRQTFRVPKNDFNHDHLFYAYIQNGKNRDNMAMSTGSGVVYRRSAIESIGGFPTWSLVEDLYASILLQRTGWRTLYVHDAYTEGFAPVDIKGIYKQRGTWALDTLRIFMHDSPLFARGLTLKQRLHHFELGITYCISAFSIPALFLTPSFALIGNIEIIEDMTGYLLVRIPSLVALLYFYHYVCRGSAAGQYWAGLWPVYLKAFFQAIRGAKVPYRVTDKAAVPNREIKRILPQLGIVLFSVTACTLYYINNGLTAFLVFNMTSTALALYWFSPLIIKAVFPARVQPSGYFAPAVLQKTAT